MGKWEDIGVREASGGRHYLLQMKVKKNGRKIFRNRRIDQTLFHGMQGIEEPILAPTKLTNPKVDKGN